MTEFVAGGPILEYFTHQMHIDSIKFYLAEILIALENLHKMGIIYRDLKPENILIDQDGHVKLVDFGFAKVLHKGRTYTSCGTAQYVSPELLLNQGYGFEADIWAYGIVMCEFVARKLPFSEPRNSKRVHAQILRRELCIPSSLDS